MSKKIIFITGTGHSGSTLLDLMLGNSETGFSAGELYALFRPWRPHHLLRKRSCFCNNSNCSFWSDIKNDGERRVYINLFEKLDNVDYIVDSSKDILWLKDQLEYSRNYDYEFLPVLIYKTPLEYAYSLEKRGMVQTWDDNWITTHRRLFALLEDFVSVKYSNLAKRPALTLQNLCEEINITYFPGKERFWDGKHDHFLFGSTTARKSEHLVYYQKQYDEDKMNYLKGIIREDTEIIKNIKEILEAYGLNTDSKISDSIIKSKNVIGYFSYWDLFKLRSQGSPYYLINCFTCEAKKIIKGWFRRIKDGISVIFKRDAKLWR